MSSQGSSVFTNDVDIVQQLSLHSLQHYDLSVRVLLSAPDDGHLSSVDDVVLL